MSAGHTPGPWRVIFSGGYAIEGRDGATVFLIDDKRRLIPTLADGRIIAAAPNLLEILEALVDPESGCRLTTLALTNARAAIANARGEQ